MKLKLFVAVALLVAAGQGVSAAEDMPRLAVGSAEATGAWSALDKEMLEEAANDVKPWSGPIPAQSGSPRFTFVKTGGSAYAIRQGLYSGGAEYTGPLVEKLMTGQVAPEDLEQMKPEDFSNLGTFSISAKTPDGTPGEVVLLLRIQGLPPGPHFSPFELIEKAFPAILKIAGNDLRASSQKMVSTKLAGGFHEELYALRWDLSNVKTSAEGYSIEWTTYPHSMTTGVRVQEAKAYTEAFPELINE